MNNLTLRHRFVLRMGAAICSGVFLWLSWPPFEIAYPIFFAWIPLLWLATNVTHTRRFTFYVLMATLIWNVCTTWWIWNASPPGAIGAIMLNSIFMCIPWIGFHRVYKKGNKQLAYVALIAYWMCFEYIHFNWDLSWPWLTLGNIFATQPTWIQWYEYTGTSGGTLWILSINILLWQVWKTRKKYKHLLCNKYVYWTIGSIFIPFGMSMFILIQRQKLVTDNYSNKKNVVIVQPNIDPYTEKFADGTQKDQIQKLIQLSLTQIDSNTRLVIWPETAIPTKVLEDEIKTNEYYQPVFELIHTHPTLTLVTGIDSYKKYTDQDTIPTSAQKDKFGNYYDAFNTALAVDNNFTLPVYHKSKLVPGVESLPRWLYFLSKWFEGFGGMSGTYGTQLEPSVFPDFQQHYIVAPIICYESIYGEYVSRYVRKGANILAIITNDGWWGNTEGYQQHMLYARLRAIENRCWVARSANTGISCFIDPLGDIKQPQPWNTAVAIKMSVPTRKIKTFYTQYGDILYYTAVSITIMMVIWALYNYMNNLRLKKYIKNTT